MKTDEFFYELFKLDAQSLFRLVQIEIEGEYEFESITVKTTEKRFDGFCRRIDGTGPNIFLEIQGYKDSVIYWRFCREISTYYEQTGSQTPFIAIVLFLEAKDDPENCVVSFVPPNRLLRANVIDCLKAMGDQAGILTVLKPLTISTKEEVFETVRQWETAIRSLQLPEEKINTLIGLLEYIILQRFPGLTPKEVEMMLQLTPIEKTVVGQELIQKGIAQGIQQGDSQGQLKRARKAVNDVLEVRFDIVPRSIIHEIDRIEDVQVLEKLHRKSVNVKDFKEFRSILKKVLA